MKNIKLILIVLILLSSILIGCVQPPVSTPPPTATPTATETAGPTAISTTSAPTPAPTPVRTPVVYRSDVDSDYGFYRVIDTTSKKPFVYENKTLNIYTGDTVIWVNDATPDERLTIISEQDLWANTSSILRWNYQQFNYTFTVPGIYSVYIREYPRLQHQKIIVNTS